MIRHLTGEDFSYLYGKAHKGWVSAKMRIPSTQNCGYPIRRNAEDNNTRPNNTSSNSNYYLGTKKILDNKVKDYIFQIILYRPFT